MIKDTIAALFALRNFRGIFLAAMASLALSTSVLAQETFDATADAFTRNNDASANYGAQNDFRSQKWRTTRGFVRFDLSSFSGSSASSAFLEIGVDDNNGSTDMDVHKVLADWGELTITHNNQPAYGPSVATFPVSTSDVGTTISVDITYLFNQLIADPANDFGFVITTDYLMLVMDARETGNGLRIVATPAGPANNQAPTVDAGADFTVTVNSTEPNAGSVTDDGLPNPPANTTIAWSVVSGPGSVTITDVADPLTDVAFDAIGTYVLRLTGDDSEFAVTDDLTVTVIDPPSEETLVTTGDTTTKSLEATRNFGDDDKVRIQKWAQLTGFYAFDLSTLPQGFTASDAQLKFRVQSVGLAGTINVRKVLSSWDEMTLTHDTKPALGPVAASFTISSADIGQNVQVDITTLFNDLLNDPANDFGIAMDSDEANFHTDSGESGIATEIIATPSLANIAPVVDAGSNQSITLPANANLSGSFTDDGRPNPPALTTVAWVLVSGPGSVTFGDSTSLSTTATFSTAGNYELRLTADDGEYTASDTVDLIVASSGGVPAPTGLVGPANDSDGSFTLTWNAAAGAVSYRLEEQLNGGTWTQIYTGSTLSYSPSGRNDGTYNYRVKGCDIAAVCGAWSSMHIVVVSLTPPPQDKWFDTDASDFPDAAIVDPQAPSGDIYMNSVGAMNGSGGVSGGQASYTIPVVVPPGRKGMQPSVSLNYSSSSGNGIAGVGWGVSGVSGISRCAATVDPDGYTAAVQYDANRDRLCLDGRRLVAVDGYTYGASSAEYRTELDIFARITQNGSINSPTSSFTVNYKNNRTSRYGLDSSSRHSAPGRTEIMTWSISDTQDPSGNTITYDYIDHGYGEHNIDAIHYTGVNGLDGDRHVRFTYETRPDTRTFYRAGGKTRSTKRLTSIRTEYQFAKVREYTLTYDDPGQLLDRSLSTDRSLLRSMQECAYQDGVTAHCLPPTTFEWQEHAPQYVTEQLQFSDPNNLNTPDNVNTIGNDPVIVHADKRWLHEVVPHGDTDGDGVKDWSEWYVNAEGEITGEYQSTLSNCVQRANSWKLSCPEADFNADGLTDSFRQNNLKFEIKLAGTWVNTGVDWDTNLGPGRGDTPLGFADFNGDGWVDIAFKQNSALWIYFHTTNTSAPYSVAQRQWLLDYPYSGGSSDSISVQIYGDMDGNGTPDFVVSNFPGSTLVPGLPRPQDILLTESQIGGTMTVTSRPVTNLMESINGSAHFFHDLNGDGLQDILAMGPYPSAILHYRLNDGTDFVGTWTSLGFAIPTRSGLHEIGSGELEPYSYPVMSKVLVMDYDGDGRDEILIAGDVKASGCAKIPEFDIFGNMTMVWRCDDELYATYNSNSSSNLATDEQINSAVLDNSIREFKARKFSEDSNGDIVVSNPIDTGIIASAAQTAVVDATGDGLPDVVTVFGCRLPTGCEFNTETTGRPDTEQFAPYVEGAWINRNLGTATGGDRFAGYDLISAVQNGFDNRSEWTYKPLSSDAFDTNSSDFYETDHNTGSTDYFHFTSSMNVVAEHRVSNGVGGFNSKKYRYRDAIFNNKGRGFQGFKAIIVEEDVYAAGHGLAGTDKISRTNFHQMWPLSSQVEQSCTWLVVDPYDDDNPNCTGALTQTTTNSIHNVATTGGARFVAISDQTQQTFDLSTRVELVTRQTQRGFDLAGNVTSEIVMHDDDWTVKTSQINRTYDPDWGGWWLNKIVVQTVTQNPVSTRHASSPTVIPGTDETKAVTTNFTQLDVTHRLPSTIVVSANDSPLTQTTTSLYNARGQAQQVTIVGTDVAGPRTVDTTYTDSGTTASPDGYFPYTITNVLGHVSEQHSDPKLGLPTSQWDPNDLLTTTVYDAFGRVSDVTLPGQPAAKQRYFWCGGATSCPTGAILAIKTYRAGAPETHSFVDQLGREIQTSVANFAGSSFVNQSTAFDERGNTTFKSAPYDIAAGESSSIGARFLSYDALSRLQSKEIDQADGSVFLTSYTFNEFKTSINASGLLMHRTYNGLEQLVETQDAMGGYTRYAYDGAGNPIVLQDPNGHSITASYNSLGHKNSVDDPNMGLKNFTYNALGEVLTELDANGDDISMDYDELGRLEERRVNGALTGSWAYDNTASNKGLGLLDIEDSHPASDGSGLQKHYFYSSASTGRKDLTQVTHRFYEGGSPSNATDYDTTYYTDSFYARPKGIGYPGGIGVGLVYNNAGHVTKEVDASSSFVVREVTARDSRNQVTASTLTNGLLNQTAEYYSASGQMKSINVAGPSGNVHSLNYEYDVFGNLDYQGAQYGGATSTESFIYDDLHRLKQSDRVLPNGSSTINYDYDASGNLTLKDDYATSYSYDSNQPNAVDSVIKVGGGSATFLYDANGNLESGDGKTIDYNAFNKPVLITAGGVTAGFYYGSDLSRYKQTKSGGETVLYIDKMMEIVTVGSTSDYRHYVSDVAILTKTGDLNDPYPAVNYLHRDRLGSLATITDQDGIGAQARGFDPFGKPRNGDWADRNPATLDSTITDRGFTEHEHLDESQLIHMNGRVYDYNLGRFLSVDPFIQAPGNSQSPNAYSYVMNNPLSGTDPTGYASSCIADKDNCPDANEEASETTISVRSIGSRLPHNVTVTATSAGKFTAVTFSGGNGAARQVAANAVSKHFGEAGFEVDQINSQANDGSMIDVVKNMAIGMVDKIIEAGFHSIPDPAEWPPNAMSIAEMCECSYVSPFDPPENTEAILGRDLSAIPAVLSMLLTRKAFTKPKAGPTAGPQIKPGTSGGTTAGERFPASVRKQAFEENPNKTCVFCRREGKGTQVDHAIPRSRNGDATIDNAQLACPHCNPSKGARDLPVNPPPGYEGPWPRPEWPR